MTFYGVDMLPLHSWPMPVAYDYANWHQQAPALPSPPQTVPVKLGKRRRVSEDELCQICGAKATGYHYGVAACHGCKAFFRRSILSGETFVCRFDGNCQIAPNDRCACRRCRLDKCFLAGMDVSSLQGERDKRKSTTIKTEQPSTPQPVHAQCSLPAVPVVQTEEQLLLEQLSYVENACNQLRLKALGDGSDLKELLAKSSLLPQIYALADDPLASSQHSRQATADDVEFWNTQERRLCIEWTKSLDGFQALSESDQLCLIENFAMPATILNRVFYSSGYDSESIVYPNGAYLTRQSPARFTSTVDRELDELMRPLRELQIGVGEFALFKAIMFFNRDASGFSSSGKAVVDAQRQKLISSLFHVMSSKQSIDVAAQRYSALLLLAAPLSSIAHQIVEHRQLERLSPDDDCAK